MSTEIRPSLFLRSVIGLSFAKDISKGGRVIFLSFQWKGAMIYFVKQIKTHAQIPK